MFTPTELKAKLGSGLLSFPVTHFDAQLRFMEQPYREHVEWLLQYQPAGLFAAGGTGEVFSLSKDEIIEVVRVSADQVKGRVPVIAGCGYGMHDAVELAKAAEAAGADGLLVFPPYLVAAEQAGLAARIDAICSATSLGVIVYSRDNGVLNETTLAGLCERNPNLIGFKDGLGDLEMMMRIRSRLGDRLAYIGGLPTAEIFALPYKAIGMDTYSSAVFNFLPELAMAFYKALSSGDEATVWRLLQDFYLPYIAIRSRKKGYAVSIVKAGLKLVGRDAGPVRPPLTELDAEEMMMLQKLIDKVKPGAAVKAVA